MYNRKDKTQTRFIKVIRLTQEDYDWINQYRKKKTAAGFLEHIINNYQNGNNETAV